MIILLTKQDTASNCYCVTENTYLVEIYMFSILRKTILHKLEKNAYNSTVFLCMLFINTK